MLGTDSRAARMTWTVFLIVLALFLAWLARKTLLVFIIALLLAYLLHPLVDMIRRLFPYKLPTVFAPGVVYVGGFGAVFAAALLIGAPIAEEATQLASRLPEFLGQPDPVLGIRLPSVLAPYHDEITTALRTQLEAAKDEVLPALSAIGRGLISQASTLLFVILVPILAFLMELSMRDFRAGIIRMFASDSDQKLAHAIVTDIDKLLGNYMRAVFLLALATFTSHLLTFGAIGVPYAVLLAGVCGVFEFVPVVGPLSGMIVVTLVAIFSGYPHIGGLVAFFLVYRLFQDYVLQPYLYSAGIEIHPLLVLFGVLAGEQIGGISGMFLSVPLLAVSRVVYRRLIEARSL